MMTTCRMGVAVEPGDPPLSDERAVDSVCTSVCTATAPGSPGDALHAAARTTGARWTKTVWLCMAVPPWAGPLLRRARTYRRHAPRSATKLLNSGDDRPSRCHRSDLRRKPGPWARSIRDAQVSHGRRLGRTSKVEPPALGRRHEA